MTPDSPMVQDDTAANGRSQVFGISIRAMLACSLVWTVCAIFAMYAGANVWLAVKAGAPLVLKIEEPLYSMAVAALGFYFGQKVAGGTRP